MLTATSLAVVVVAAVLPFAPMGAYFGFVAPPARFFLILPGMVLGYLMAVEAAKRWFCQRLTAARP